MARAQQGQVITGGGIDPYVAQASMQRSEARNRMKETMVKEKGATQRQGMQGDAQVAQTNIQAAAAKSMQDERRAAAIEDRDIEIEVRQGEKKLENENAIRRDELMEERRIAADELKWDRVEKATEKLRDQLTYENLNLRTGAANRRRTLMNVAEIENKYNTGKAGVDSALAGELKEFEEMKGIEGVATETAILSLSSESTVAITDYKDIPSEELRGLGVPVGIGTWGLVGKGAHQVKKFNDKKLFKAVSDTMTLNGVDVTAEELINNIGEVQKRIESGDITAKHFVPMHATLRSSEKLFRKRAKDAFINKDEKSQALGHYYMKFAMDMSDAQENLHQLNYAETDMMKEGVVMAGKVAKQGNFWSDEEFNDEWFAGRKVALERRKASDLRKEGDPDSMPPGIVSPDSPDITDSMRQRMHLMDLINGTYNAASEKNPAVYPSLGTPTILPEPVQGARTRFDTNTQGWIRN